MNQLTDVRHPWPQPATREYPPSPFNSPAEIHYAPAYGPHICPTCYGAGWWRPMPADLFTSAQLVKCERCNTVDAQQLNRDMASVWTASRLDPNNLRLAELSTFRPHDDPALRMKQAAAAFIKQPRGWLTFYGARGGGKTHLAEAITRALLERQVPCLYMQSADLWRYCGAIEREGGFEREFIDYDGRRRWVAAVDVLVLDELGWEKDTATVQTYRHDVLAARYRAAEEGSGGATVLISNDAPGQWKDQTVASRALDARFVAIETTPVDYRQVQR